LGLGQTTGETDGDLEFNQFIVTDVLQNVVAPPTRKPVKRQMKFTITNTDNSTHTIDFWIVGILINLDDFEDFISEITGRENLRNQREIIRQNMDIIRLLNEINNKS